MFIPKQLLFILISFVICNAADLSATIYGETFINQLENTAYLDMKLAYNNAYVTPFASFLNYGTDYSAPLLGLGIDKSITYKKVYLDGFAAVYADKSVRIGITSVITFYEWK